MKNPLVFLELSYRLNGTLSNYDFDQAKTLQDEQMIRFAEFVASYPEKNKNVNGEMLHAKSKYDEAERTVDLLKLFERTKKQE
jgi:hypothetical protein